MAFIVNDEVWGRHQVVPSGERLDRGDLYPLRWIEWHSCFDHAVREVNSI
jgi:hypothetical protein